MIPAAYAVTVYPAHPAVRHASRPRALLLTRSTAKDFAPGPRPGVYTARFVSGSAPIRNISGSAVDGAGDVATIFTLSANGRARNDSLRPGHYRYRAKSFSSGGNDDVPAVDGPWSFGPPSGSFRIRSGSTTDLGTIALHVHAAR